jgi:hypothetical protein
MGALRTCVVARQVTAGSLPNTLTPAPDIGAMRVRAELQKRYLQAFWRAVQVGRSGSPVHFMETGPTDLAPMPLIEFFSAAVAMNFAISAVIMVA